MKGIKKICIVSPSLKIGGIERALTVLANYFAEQGHSVSFISCLCGDHFYSVHPAVKIYEPNFKRSSSSLDKAFHYFRTAAFIREQVRAIDPDVVLSFGDNFNPLVLLALSHSRYRVFISDRTSPDFPLSTLVRVGKRLFYPRAAGFIAQTEIAAISKRDLFGDRLKIRVIPNAIREVNIVEGVREKWIVTVARLSNEKGIDRLIGAFAQVRNRQGWKLVIVGSGPEEKALKKLTATLALTEEVEFKGRIKNVDEVLQRASIFVLPSYVEGFPNALCEAMIAGIPSICFDCIPTQGILEQRRNGIIVKDGDLLGMASAIQQLIDDPALRNSLGKEASLLKERLSVDRIGMQYLDFMFL